MIEVEHLSKTYGSTPAIQDVTFAVEEGEILGFLGPNGAGKTTTMRILAGYLPATTGTARIAGYDVHENSMAVRQKIGYLPETPPLYPEMTVEGYLDFVARLKRVSPGDRITQVNQVIARCGLKEKRSVTIDKLSKGFRQRVGIAQAIVHNPPVIILDEPTVGLDPRQIIEVRNLIKSLAGDHTIILSTHILPEVSMTCTQVAIINRGIVVASDSLENLMDETQGRSVYELELQANHPTQVQNMIQEVSGVLNVQALSSEHLLPNHYRFRVTTDPNMEAPPEITSTLSLVGVKLYEMRRLGTSLEDVFLRLTSTDMPNLELSSGSDARELDDQLIKDKTDEIPFNPRSKEGNRIAEVESIDFKKMNSQESLETFPPLPSSLNWWDEPIPEQMNQTDDMEMIDFSQVNPEDATEQFPPLPSSLEWWGFAPVETESSEKKNRNPFAFLWRWFKRDQKDQKDQKADRAPQDRAPVPKPKPTQQKTSPIDRAGDTIPEEPAQPESEQGSESATTVRDENSDRSPETNQPDLSSEQNKEGEA